jgi:hypothetical protein
MIHLTIDFINFGSCSSISHLSLMFLVYFVHYLCSVRIYFNVLFSPLVCQGCNKILQFLNYLFCSPSSIFQGYFIHAISSNILSIISCICSTSLTLLPPPYCWPLQSLDLTKFLFHYLSTTMAKEIPIVTL